jgi:hypothetical protein
MLCVESTKLFNSTYGHAPHLAEAINKIKEKYEITARTSTKISGDFVKALLLEVEPKDN